MGIIKRDASLQYAMKEKYLSFFKQDYIPKPKTKEEKEEAYNFFMWDIKDDPIVVLYYPTMGHGAGNDCSGDILLFESEKKLNNWITSKGYSKRGVVINTKTADIYIITSCADMRRKLL